MANNHSNLTSLFTDIADAIRSKTGGSDPIIADQFPEAIEGIESGGGSDDGFPIGDGNTHFWVDIPEGRNAPRFSIGVNGTALVDWGDGSEPVEVTSTQTNYMFEVGTHIYEKPGKYVISVISDNPIGVSAGSSYNSLFTISGNYETNTYVYANIVRKVELSKNMELWSHAFRQFNGLQEVYMEDGLSEINDYVFGECDALAYVKLSNEITAIPNYLFYNTRGVAYYDFTSFSTIPTLYNANSFNTIREDCEIRVPAALADEWKAATNWATYADYIVGV